MATKKMKEEGVKKTADKPEESKPEKIGGPYFYGLGKRKTSMAQVRLYHSEKGEKEIMVNGKKMENYFPVVRLQTAVKAPLVAVGQAENFDAVIKVFGGGTTGQAEAARLGIARALVKFDETLKKALKDLGFLTRDARKVERKKPGFRKARRSPQWAKR